MNVIDYSGIIAVLFIFGIILIIYGIFSIKDESRYNDSKSFLDKMVKVRNCTLQYSTLNDDVIEFKWSDNLKANGVNNTSLNFCGMMDYSYIWISKSCNDGYYNVSSYSCNGYLRTCNHEFLHYMMFKYGISYNKNVEDFVSYSANYFNSPVCMKLISECCEDV